MTETRFYIELPADEHGNTAIRPAVIEGRIVQGGTPEAGYFSNPDRKALLFTGPPEIAQHVGMYVDAYGGYAETEGPARMLSDEEYDALIAGLRVTDAETAEAGQ